MQANNSANGRIIAGCGSTPGAAAANNNFGRLLANIGRELCKTLHREDKVKRANGDQIRTSLAPRITLQPPRGERPFQSRTGNPPVSAPELVRSASLAVSSGEGGAVTLKLSGWLDAHTISSVWEQCRQVLRRSSSGHVVVDASAIEYCDSSGVAMLIDLQRASPKIEIRGLSDKYQPLLELFDPKDFKECRPIKPVPCNLPIQIGETSVQLGRDIAALVRFVGELASALAFAVRHPRQVRWADALLAAENAGVNALPIVALISFLIGLIMAFQSAIPMSQFGAEIYVADLVALSMLRELGPLMTAIILAGRSGSAFAAELGTMKVNEEIDALTTMGLDPVRFLVVTRVLAAVVMMPLLTLFSNLMGLLGGGVVFLSFDYPIITYVQQVLGAIEMGDLIGGLAKAFVFGILVAGIGCLRGLQTQTGASAVGLSTTRAVVSGIVLIVLADGVFSVVFYYLGI
jgi:phospholipid/cholesterol/gamma-HCH transport system permease protein